LKKGDLVKVTWLDIMAELHTEDEIEPVTAETVGWIDCNNKRWIRIVTTHYLENRKFSRLADKIVIPKGCIIKVAAIEGD